jgi:hypothetical protein
MDNLYNRDRDCSESDNKSEMIHLITLYPPEDIFMESVLKQAGITVVKFKESMAAIHGICVGPLAEIKLFVPKSQEQEARDIIDSLPENGIGEDEI